MVGLPKKNSDHKYNDDAAYQGESPIPSLQGFQEALGDLGHVGILSGEAVSLATG